ncbi:protein of unknown function; putative anti-sigma factor domain (plasmid) [Azospirillum lipoferum 4B]|uniref:Uncharacterized protein n=2 Tax=Azospirillum lipoferum TaxID=193 RepID=G7ZDT7_AZOL4|nr:protein of unknown function; putative anti-sigma factor domain [Azospirillum lipoferum 4B]
MGTRMNGECQADLHAYIDGELDAERRLAFEAFLASNPAAAARLHDYLHQREALRQGFARMAGESPRHTESLTGRLYGRLRTERLIRRFGPLAAAILLLVGGANIVALVHHQQKTASYSVPDFAEEAAEMHETAVSQSLAFSDLSLADLNAMAEGSTHRLGPITVKLPALDPNLLTLLRATLVPLNSGVGLQFVYRERDGEMLTLLVVAGDPIDDKGLHAVEERGLQLVYWRNGATAYTLAGSRSDSDLLVVAKKMADSVRRS